MPLSVEMPAPVRTVTRRAPVSQPGRGSGTVPLTRSTVGSRAPDVPTRGVVAGAAVRRGSPDHGPGPAAPSGWLRELVGTAAAPVTELTEQRKGRLTSAGSRPPGMMQGGKQRDG